MNRTATAPIVVLIFALLPSALHPQEHAPTADVCRADLAAWKPDLNVWMEDHTSGPIMKMPVNETLLRSEEMSTCAVVDGDGPLSEEYHRMALYYLLPAGDRFHRFLKRHELWEQFNNEDAAGIR